MLGAINQKARATFQTGLSSIFFDRQSPKQGIFRQLAEDAAHCEIVMKLSPIVLTTCQQNGNQCIFTTTSQ